MQTNINFTVFKSNFYLDVDFYNKAKYVVTFSKSKKSSAERCLRL